MVKPLLDTNILIDYLSGLEEARSEVLLYAEISISIVTWMEVMVGAPKTGDAATRRFLQRFEIIELDNSVAELAITIRRDKRIKLPDAIIEATARSRNLLLVTRNSRDFPSSSPSVRIPYILPTSSS